MVDRLGIGRDSKGAEFQSVAVLRRSQVNIRQSLSELPAEQIILSQHQHTIHQLTMSHNIFRFDLPR